MIWSIAPVSAPLKARNGEPGSALIATGAPVIAACFAGSVYIAKRLSAGAERTTDWEMMLRMGPYGSRLAQSAALLWPGVLTRQPRSPKRLGHRIAGRGHGTVSACPRLGGSEPVLRSRRGGLGACGARPRSLRP